MEVQLPAGVRYRVAWYSGGHLPSPAPPQQQPKEEKKQKKDRQVQQPARDIVPIERFDKGDFGDIKLVQSAFSSARTWTEPKNLSAANDNELVWIRARLHTVRSKGKMVFLLLRRGVGSVQCIAADDGSADAVARDLVKFAGKINPESIVDVYGRVAKTDRPVESATQSDIEIKVKKIFVISASVAELPFQLDDAARRETGAEDEITVSQNTRLAYRYFDLRTPTNHAIFKVQSAVGQYYREYFLGLGFTEIHSPKITPGVSEGGADVFHLKYFGRDACLAQSPQLYKQMAISADFQNVFEIGPVFRAENSNTHRHMCEFTGMDFEMEIKEHYHEVLRVLGNVFVSIFDNLNKNNQVELQAIGKQYPFEPLQYRPIDQTLVLHFPEGAAMLKASGVTMGEFEDLTTENEKKLGALVKAKYGTDFYILDKYPLDARPFYTMPCPNDPRYTNSYDVFLRGEEITSGAQRIHDVNILAERALAKGIPLSNLASYLESFKYGSYPHGGAGIGLERVTMLFLGLNNIRKSALFPRTPNVLEP